MWMPLAAAALTIVSALVVYDPTKVGLPADAGMLALFVTVPAAVVLIWKWTSPKPSALDTQIALFAAWGDRTHGLERVAEPAGTYRSPPGTRRVELQVQKLPDPTFKRITALPSDLAIALEQVGSGKPIALLEIHPKLAYVAILSSDAGSVSDWTSIVLKLDKKAPAFDLRPLVAGDPLPARNVGFKDEEFAAKFVIEGDDPKAIRSYLIPDLRDELIENDDLHVLTQDKAMVLTAFGAFDRVRAMRLLDVADVFFAEYGAEGGPALRDALDAAFEAALAAAPESKKLKKKKKKPAPPATPDPGGATPSEA